MKKTSLPLVVLALFGLALGFVGCDNLISGSGGGGGGGNGGDSTYSVMYDGNGHDGGSPPVDLNAYSVGETVTVATPGSMSRTGHLFVDWNTASDGSGIGLSAGDTFTMPANDVPLYAQWSPLGGSALGDVSNLQTAVGDGEVTLTWDDPPNPDLDHVEISWTPDGGTAESVSAGDETYTVTGLTNGTTYTFAVVAVATDDTTSTGKTITATPNVADPEAPAEVSELVATAGDGQVELTWTDPPDADLESIEITWTPDGDTVQSISAGVESYTATGLANDVEYTFTIVTVDDADNSSFGRTITATPVAGGGGTVLYNLLTNPSADNGTTGWTTGGTAGADTMPVSGSSVFYTEDMDGDRAQLFQLAELPEGSGGKYLLALGYGWVAETVDGSITRHPYLYAYEQSSTGGILNYLQGQNMRHTAAAKTWQTMSGIFELSADADQITLFLKQAYGAGDPPDGTRATFDDLELLVFDTLDDAEGYRDAYLGAHPEVFEDDASGGDGPANLLVNPTADNGLDGWTATGPAGAGTMPVSGSTVFYTEEDAGSSAHLSQSVDLPEGSGGKYLLMIGYGWVAYTVDGSITRHPYLYGYERSSTGGILNYLQGQNMRHTADAETWQTMNGIFQLETEATAVTFFLMQASEVGDDPDGTRATFDDLELLVFDTLTDAEAYRDSYIADHPEAFEDAGAGGDGPANLLVNPTADDGTTGWSFQGVAGAGTMPVSGSSVFYTEDEDGNRASIIQNASLPGDAGGKYLLLIGYGWVELAIQGSITRHPYLYAYEKNSTGGILNYLQGQNMRHTAATKTWQTMSGIFQLEANAAEITLFLRQASAAGDPPDGTRATFDDLELLLFDAQADAESYRDAYITDHPEVFEDTQ